MLEKIDKIQELLNVPNVDASTETAIANIKILNLLVDLRAEAKQLILCGVSGMLPNDFKRLPEKLQCKLVRKHTHAELVDGEKIVYEEQDLLDIIKYVSEGNYR